MGIAEHDIYEYAVFKCAQLKNVIAQIQMSECSVFILIIFECAKS